MAIFESKFLWEMKRGIIFHVNAPLPDPEGFAAEGGQNKTQPEEVAAFVFQYTAVADEEGVAGHGSCKTIHAFEEQGPKSLWIHATRLGSYKIGLLLATSK